MIRAARTCRVDHCEIDEPDAIWAPIRLARERVDWNWRAVDEPAEGRGTEADRERLACATADSEVDVGAGRREGDFRVTGQVCRAASVEPLEWCG